jgi:hypothetical protein
MARYKPIDTSPRFLAVDLERQLLPGTFEHALHWIVTMNWTCPASIAAIATT